MTIKEKIWKVAKYLPICNLYDLFKKSTNVPRLRKLVPHILYAYSFFFAFTFWGARTIETRELNPIRQQEVFNSRYERIIKEDKLFNLIFNKGGLADKNKDGCLSFDEFKDAYERMGKKFVINQEFYRPSGKWERHKGYHQVSSKFVELNLSDLEKAVKSYETEK